MELNTHGVLVGLLATVAGFLASYIHLYQLPEVLEAGIIFILVVALVGILLAYDARVSLLRCVCAFLLCAFVAGCLYLFLLSCV